MLEELDWPVRRTQLCAMIDEGAKIVAKALGTSVAEVAHPAATMRLVELPFDGVDLHGGEAFKIRVSRDLKAEITLTASTAGCSSGCRPTPTTALRTTSRSPSACRRCSEAR